MLILVFQIKSYRKMKIDKASNLINRSYIKENHQVVGSNNHYIVIIALFVNNLYVY